MTTEDILAAESLEREAARSLAEALSLVVHLRGREPRERHRRLLDHAIDRAERALATAGPATQWRARAVLVRAYAARAEDALHGAGQLSLSAQRAPTAGACDEGWRRVESIVVAAEEASRAAGSAAAAMAGDSSSAAHAARAAACRAEGAALAARKIVDDRNYAYTFHTDSGFSFGEGWYLAAAAVLGGVAIQIEPGRPGTASAARFLRDAGLGDRLRPYRSRPRANKQTTDVVARAFRADPPGAQQRLRAAFLGDAPITPAVGDWIDPRLAGWRDQPKALVWIRDGAHHPGRNTVFSELLELTRRVQQAGLVPILVGDALREGPVPEGAVDMTLFWKDPVFRGDHGRRAQLQFFEHLRDAHHVVGQLGVTTAGMDGPALVGMPTMYLTDAPNVRMRAWVGAVPGYREIARERGYLDRVSHGLREWAARGAPRASCERSPADTAGSVRSRWEAAARLVAENRDVLDERPGGECDVPEALVSRGWSDFLLSLDDEELSSVETDGLDAGWPERTPGSLRALVARAREVCSMPALVRAGSGAAGWRPGETPRKRAQVDAFRALLLSVGARVTRVVDVGSGHGHLTRAIAERTEHPVVGLERDAALARRATTLSEGCGPTFVVTDVLRDGLTPRSGDCFVGLHACGELGDAMVTTVAETPGTSLVLVGCCLQKRRPLSRRPLCPVPGTGERLDLPRRLLGLSNLTARDEGVEASRSENLAARERRLALHRLLTRGWGPIRLGAEIDGLNRRAAQRDLSSLVARAFARRGAPPPPAAAIDEAARWAHAAHARARRLGLPRALLARVLEVYVILDRAMLLERSGFVVRVGAAFPVEVSARNLALVAGQVAS